MTDIALSRALLSLTALFALAGCATAPAPEEPLGPVARETLLAVTADLRLIRFNGGQPQRLTLDLPLRGLQAGETVLGIDFRVARNQLYLLANSGQLYRVRVADAQLEPVGPAVPLPIASTAGNWGFDFNPTVDRLRVVHESGLNLRRHPDTGAMVDGDPAKDGVQPDAPLAFDAADPNAGKPARIGAAAYTYNADNPQITTNYAIDLAQGLLVRQGSVEGAQPVISPNSGRLFTVGSLGLKPTRVQFDISDVRNTAYIATDAAGGDVLYRVDLATGAAQRVARIGGGLSLLGLAIEP